MSEAPDGHRHSVAYSIDPKRRQAHVAQTKQRSIEFRSHLYRCFIAEILSAWVVTMRISIAPGIAKCIVYW